MKSPGSGGFAGREEPAKRTLRTEPADRRSRSAGAPGRDGDGVIAPDDGIAVGRLPSVPRMRPATAEDLDGMLETLARARRLMAEAGNPTQWGTSFPRRSSVEEDIRLGRAFLLVDDADGGTGIVHERQLAQFALCEGDDPSYVSIDGAWLDDDPYVAVHRLASTGLRPRSARTCLEWVLEAHPNVRIDTHRNNHAMRHILAGLGFTFCGTILLPDRDEDRERLAFQRHDRHGGDDR